MATPLPCASMTQPSKRCLPSSREAALWPWVGEWGASDLWGVICHECAGVRGRRDAHRAHTLDFGKAQARAPAEEWGGRRFVGVHVMNALVSEHVVSCMRNPVISFMIKCTERETETDRERERVLLGTISLSTSEAEYVAASQCGQEVVYLREILRDFGFIPIGPTQVYEDNLACVAMSENPVRRKYSRHIDIRSYFVRDLVAQNVLKLIPCPS